MLAVAIALCTAAVLGNSMTDTARARAAPPPDAPSSDTSSSATSERDPSVPPAPRSAVDGTVGGTTVGGTADAVAGGTIGGAVRVALVDSGVNYTLPAIAAALARQSDGSLVGYDFRDMDARPFDRHPLPGGRIVRHGTRTASVLIDEAPRARLVPYRFPQTDMTRMTALVEHAAANGVRVVGLPLGGPKRAPWEAFERAARAHPDLLFVASAGNDGRDVDAVPVWPAAFGLDNLVVVTSADDFGRLADGVNRGRASVDYLVPAEHVPVLRFDGSRSHAAGSSYAVPRVVALAARLLERHPEWRAAELVAEIRRRFADGSHPRDVGGGFIADPLSVAERAPRVVGLRDLDPPAFAPSSSLAGFAGDAAEPAADSASTVPAASDTSSLPDAAPFAIDVPLDVVVPNAAWSDARAERTLVDAAAILVPCGIRLSPVRVLDVDAPERLADLSLGGAHTLFDAVRASGPERRATLVLARDTRMRDPYDGEAFGRGNTRHRPWLTDSVWLTAAIRDEGIALAHELFHVLANSGAHDDREGNLMNPRTSGGNVRLEPAQCEAARRAALANGTARKRAP